MQIVTLLFQIKYHAVHEEHVIEKIIQSVKINLIFNVTLIHNVTEIVVFGNFLFIYF